MHLKLYIWKYSYSVCVNVCLPVLFVKSFEVGCSISGKFFTNKCFIKYLFNAPNLLSISSLFIDFDDVAILVLIHTLIRYILDYNHVKQMFLINCKKNGSCALNPGAVFLRFFTVAFLLFLAPAGGSNSAGQSLTLN